MTPMTTTKLPAAAAAIVALAIQAADAAPKPKTTTTSSRVEELRAGLQNGTDAMSVVFIDDGANNHSGGSIISSVNFEESLDCRTAEDAPLADVVHIGPQLRRATGEVDAAAQFFCIFGAVTTVSLDCAAIGPGRHRENNRAIDIQDDGTRWVTVVEVDSRGADCTIEIDGVPYEATTGSILRRVTRTTRPTPLTQ